MQSKHLFAVVASAAVVGIVSVSFAALLGTAGILDFPVLVYDSQGTTTYNADADLLAIDASPIAIRFAPTLPPRFVNPTGDPASEILTIGALVDATGALIGGVSGDDLIIEGELDADGDGSIDYAGVLLTGEVAEFGFQDTGPTDQYDFRFTLAGGLLASFYEGRDLGVTVSSEGSDFTGAFTVDFGGGAKGVVGGLDAVCALDVTKEGCVVPPPQPAGDSCQGEVTEFVLRYTGEGCGMSQHSQDPDKVSCTGDAAFAEPVRILVSNSSGTKVYADVPAISLEGEVIATVENADEHHCGSKTRVRIFDADEVLIEDVEFHTSCSQPLNPGDQFGSLFLATLTSTEGGEVVYEEPTDECITEFMPSTGFGCDGKVTSLQLLYTGGDCAQMSHSQDPDKVSCDGDAGIAEPVRVLVTDKDGKRVYADVENVPLGGVVLATAVNASRGKLKSETRVRIFDIAGNQLQDVKFHTSCSQPMELGDQFGSVQLAGMETTRGGSGSLGAEVEYTYTVTNNGTVLLTDVTITDDMFGEVPGSPIVAIAPGETVELALTAFVLGTTTNTATVVGQLGPNVTCEAMASSTVTAIEPPEPLFDCCESGDKLQRVTMAYTGADCGATSHSQNPKKVFCDGAPSEADPVHIIASNKRHPNHHHAKIWFDGQVNLGDQFVIDAMNAGKSKLKSNTWVHVLDLEDNVLQTIKFHTSCSQPLIESDQFGSLMFVECTQEGGPDEGLYCVGHSKPRVLTMRYTGDACGVGQHSQDADKVFCDGEPAGATPVHIRASNKEDPNDSEARVWFDGQVALNAQFDIDAANAGKNKLKSDMWVHVFDETGLNLLQTIEFHASCSQPLNEGDQFGSLVLEGFIAE